MRLWGGEGVWVRREGASRRGWGWGGSAGAEGGACRGSVWGVDVDVGLAGGAEGGERLWL